MKKFLCSLYFYMVACILPTSILYAQLNSNVKNFKWEISTAITPILIKNSDYELVLRKYKTKNDRLSALRLRSTIHFVAKNTNLSTSDYINLADGPLNAKITLGIGKEFYKKIDKLLIYTGSEIIGGYYSVKLYKLDPLNIPTHYFEEGFLMGANAVLGAKYIMLPNVTIGVESMLHYHFQNFSEDGLYIEANRKNRTRILTHRVELRPLSSINLSIIF